MDITVWGEIFEERSEAERQLRFRHPGFDFAYNWIVAITALALMLAAVVWAVQIHRDRRDAESGRTGLCGMDSRSRSDRTGGTG